jgi:hypothetical protein
MKAGNCHSELHAQRRLRKTINRAGSDSNFSTAKRRRFYSPSHDATSRSWHKRTFGGYSVLWREIGGIWRAAPGEDDNFVYAIPLHSPP